MRRRRAAGQLVVSGLVVAGAAACGDDGADRAAHVAVTLCATVQAWSDNAVQEVKDFRLASRGLSPDERRTRYADAFARLDALHGRFERAIGDLDLSADVDDRLDVALDSVQVIIDEGADEAAQLPDEAYDYVAVREGSLVTGVEKAKAVTFNTLSDLAGTPSTGVPRGCGRRDELDLSPPATFPS